MEDESHNDHDTEGTCSMKIDRKTTDSFLRLPDDKLWQLIRLLAGPNFSVGEMDEVKLRKLRAVLTALTDEDLERIETLRTLFKETK